MFESCLESGGQGMYIYDQITLDYFKACEEMLLYEGGLENKASSEMHHLCRQLYSDCNE